MTSLWIIHQFQGTVRISCHCCITPTLQRVDLTSSSLRRANAVCTAGREICKRFGHCPTSAVRVECVLLAGTSQLICCLCLQGTTLWCNVETTAMYGNCAPRVTYCCCPFNLEYTYSLQRGWRLRSTCMTWAQHMEPRSTRQLLNHESTLVYVWVTWSSLVNQVASISSRSQTSLTRFFHDLRR